MNIRQTLSLVASLVILGVLMVIGTTGASSATIVDVSWPNCRAPHAAAYQHGVVGATGGLDFRPNKCLSKEVGWFAHYDLYMNTGYPGNARGRKFQYSPRRCSPTSSACLAYNYGYAAAVYAIGYADKLNVHAGIWWLDVETDNSWTTSPAINIASLRGAVAAVRQFVFMPMVGFYSYPGQWRQLTGGWHNGLPAWVATGQTSRLAAVLTCHTPSFTGGPVAYAQYTVALDENIACQP